MNKGNSKGSSMKVFDSDKKNKVKEQENHKIPKTTHFHTQNLHTL